MTGDLVLDLTPDGRTLHEYLLCDADVVLIQGHRASIKTSTTCDKLLMNAAQQPKVSGELVRRRRTYVVSGTYDRLTRTVMDTWQQKFPPARFGPIKWSRPPMHRIRVADLDWEVWFLALDREEETKKLLSANCSDAWVSEFREMPRRIIDELSAIVGRYPDAKNPFRAQIVGDTNAAGSHHWFSVASGQSPMPDNLSEAERVQYTMPKTWRYFIQPPAMFEVVGQDGEAIEYRLNPAREGQKHVSDAYFERLIQGRPRNWIRVNVLNKPAVMVDGDPVFPGYREEVHKAAKALEPIEGSPIIVGVDFGRTPAAVCCQRVFDRWRVLRELCAEGIGAKVFAGVLKRALAEWFPGYPVLIYGDPSGSRLSEADEISPYLMFRAAGLEIWPAPTNDPVIRIETVENILREAPDGVPRLQVSPACARLNAGMAGDYHYPSVKGTGREQAAPIKNRASHVCEALQYAMVGAGEGHALVQPLSGGARPRLALPREQGWKRLRAFQARA